MNISKEIIRIMGIHSYTYCPRLFYLEEVEGIQLANRKVYQGRALHENLKNKEELNGGEWTSIELSSEKLGLIGKVDAIRHKEGKVIPYEHKRGRCNKQGNIKTSWENDVLQLSAYTLLLEEYFNIKIIEGRIRYHEDNITIIEQINEERRQQVFNTLQKMKELLNSSQRPSITENEKLCIHCSLAPVCLPEENRNYKERKTIRLFPQSYEQTTLHVINQKAKVSKAGDTIKVISDENNVVLPKNELRSIVLHGYPQISTQALYFCTRNNINIHWMSKSGNYVSSTIKEASNVQKRIRQYKALCNEKIKLRLAKKLIYAKVETQLKYLLRATRGTDRNQNIKNVISTIKSSLRNITKCCDIDTLRGYEGSSAKLYFSTFSSIIKKNVPEEIKFTSRTKHPPKDRFNAILSFMYSLLYQNVMQAILVVNLEPCFGFFHIPRSSAHPLVMDLMELFRVTCCDIPTIGSINRMQWNIDDDFDVTPQHIWLNSSGKKKAISIYEERIKDTWKHPVVNYSLTYDRLIELEVRLLEKEWSNDGNNLFAKSKLR